MALIASAKQSVPVQKPGQSPCCIGATRKPEDVDSVTGRILLHQISVSIQHVISKTLSKRQTSDDGPFPGQSLLGRVSHSANAGMVVGYLVPVNLQGRIQLHHIGITV